LRPCVISEERDDAKNEKPPLSASFKKTTESIRISHVLPEGFCSRKRATIDQKRDGTRMNESLLCTIAVGQRYQGDKCTGRSLIGCLTKARMKRLSSRFPHAFTCGIVISVAGGEGGCRQQCKKGFIARIILSDLDYVP